MVFFTPMHMIFFFALLLIPPQPVVERPFGISRGRSALCISKVHMLHTSTWEICGEGNGKSNQPRSVPFFSLPFLCVFLFVDFSFCSSTLCTNKGHEVDTTTEITRDDTTQKVKSIMKCYFCCCCFWCCCCCCANHHILRWHSTVNFYMCA